jgi:tetratricopeptide (TPR) repeat protein
MQLTALKTGELVWSSEYRSEQVQQYDIQRSVIGIVTAAIQEFIGNDTFSIASTTAPDAEAYQLYIRGKQQFKLRGEKPLRESVRLFNEAIAIDPSFQKSYISLAEAYSVLPFYSSMPAKRGYTLALNTLDKLDPKDNNLLADSIAVKAQIATRRWEWAKADRLFQEAFSLSTQNANTYMWYSEFLSAVGRLSDSSQAAIYSKELDGISAVVNNRLAVTYLWMNDTQQAEKYFGHGYEFGFINYTNPGYAIFLLRQQKFSSATQTLNQILNSSGAATDWVEPVIASIDKVDKRQFAVESFQLAINNLQVPPRFQPPIWILLKEYKRAADSFDELIQNKYDLDIEFLFSSEAEEFRTTKAFKRLMSNVGLQQYWQDNTAPDYKTTLK